MGRQLDVTQGVGVWLCYFWLSALQGLASDLVSVQFSPLYNGNSNSSISEDFHETKASYFIKVL